MKRGSNIFDIARRAIISHRSDLDEGAKIGKAVFTDRSIILNMISYKMSEIIKFALKMLARTSQFLDHQHICRNLFCSFDEVMRKMYKCILRQHRWSLREANVYVAVDGQVRFIIFQCLTQSMISNHPHSLNNVEQFIQDSTDCVIAGIIWTNMHLTGSYHGLSGFFSITIWISCIRGFSK